MKVAGPRIQKPAEPQKESAPGPVIDMRSRGHGQDGVSGKVARVGDAHGDNTQTVALRKQRDGFDAGASRGGTRAGNLRIGESHSDNVSKVPRGESAPTVQAGSLHTLFNRLFPKPGANKPHPPSERPVGTLGTRLRFGDSYGEGTTLSLNPGNGNTGIVPPKPDNGNTGIVPPKPGSDFPIGGVYTGSIRDPNTGKKLPLLSKEALLDLKSPELTPKLVDRLAKATTLKKVDKLTRFLSGGVRDTVMRMAYASIRPGKTHSDNLQT